MRVPIHLLSCAALASAQYFSEGWKPGQPTTTATPSPSSSAPTTSRKGPLTLLSELLDLKNILGSKPSQDLFALAGINITEKLEQAAANANIWDKRIPLITDENYNEVIVNEPLTKEEEADRIWFLIITTSAMRPDGISQFVDENFDEAYNQTTIMGDLPEVRWGRIDYVNVTALTTKWNVWSAPYLVVLKDRGQTLRFFRAQHLRIKSEHLREFLLEKRWEQSPPWESSFGPGGDKEYIMDWFAHALAKVYNATVKLPKWVVYIISGSLGSMIIGWMHRPAAQPNQPVTRPVQPKPEPAVPVDAAAPSPSKRSNAKQRKGGKK